jgi:hypothetical protein
MDIGTGTARIRALSQSKENSENIRGPWKGSSEGAKRREIFHKTLSYVV